jgi:hypothetical protein
MFSRKAIKYLQNGLIGSVAALFAGTTVFPHAQRTGPVASTVVALVSGDTAARRLTDDAPKSASAVASATSRALEALSNAVRPLSHPKALEIAFHSYFAYKAAHPDQVKKPYLYFVDYGQPSTQPRGYVFDMDKMAIVEGPFAVAHGRGSSTGQYGVPTRFSNASGSAASSLGLYIARATYSFFGHSGGRGYSSIGVRLSGLSGSFNSNALDRGVVAHGAPYVTPSRAGRSEGCPAMEDARAHRLLPKIANGGLVFLFAPDQKWMQADPWITANAS